ncbi:MAG: hypothetical protein WC405_08155 [Syntrophales bacterium]
MEKRLFIIILAAILIFPLMASAQDTLTIIFKDGRQQIVNYRDVLRIDFHSSGAADYSRPSHRDINIEGLWKTSEGDVRFWQTGNQVTGSYNPKEHGELTGALSGNIMSGFWIEDVSGQKCSYPKNGRYYWGKFRHVFDGNRFSGKWGYCDAEPGTAWTGSR